jgi:hypothetical protein
MTVMTGKHEQESTAPAGKSRADVWFVLIITGVTSAVLQMWHATHSGGTVLLIAGLVGLVPAATAIGLSHVVASHKSALLLRLVVFAVMGAAMAASISAIAAVVQPIDGPYFSWVFGLALDAAALACVWVLLGDNERKAAEATALKLAQGEAEEARSAMAEAAESGRALEAELARVSAELVTANATVEALRSTPPPPPKPPRKNPRTRTSGEDVTVELRALQMLDAHPELKEPGMGSELGRRLGIHPSSGRRLHARLTAEKPSGGRPDERGQEPAPEHPRERLDDTADERS